MANLYSVALDALMDDACGDWGRAEVGLPTCPQATPSPTPTQVLPLALPLPRCYP